MENEIITWIIQGVFLLVYVIIFFIQKSQIESSKQINASMKNFMDIFKIDELKKYVQLKEERVNMQVEGFVSNSQEIKRIAFEATNKNIEPIKKMYFDQMGEEHNELILFTIAAIKTQPVEERQSLIERGLPKTKRYFLEMLDDINNDVI